MPWTNRKLTRRSSGASTTQLSPRGENAGTFRAIERWHRFSRGLFLFCTNALATLLVVVATVAFCRQVLFWWYEPTPPQPTVPPYSSGSLPPLAPFPGRSDFSTTNPMPEAWGAAERTGEILLGPSSWAWARRVVRGDRNLAVEHLSQLTASYLALSPHKQGEQTNADDPPAIDEDFVRRFSDVWTINRMNAEREVWVLPTPIPLSLGIHVYETDSSPTAHSKGDAIPSLASISPRRRVLVFGVSRPLSEKDWQLEVFWFSGRSGTPTAPEGKVLSDSPGTLRSNEQQKDSSGMALASGEPVTLAGYGRLVPDGASILLAFNTPSLGFQVLFRGAGPPNAWIKSFDHGLPAEGWTIDSGWIREGSVFRCRASRRVKETRYFLEIAIFPTGAGDYFGILFGGVEP